VVKIIEHDLTADDPILDEPPTPYSRRLSRKMKTSHAICNAIIIATFAAMPVKAIELYCSNPDVVSTFLKTEDRFGGPGQWQRKLTAIRTISQNEPSNGGTCRAILDEVWGAEAETHHIRFDVIYTYQMNDDGKSFTVEVISRVLK
jgi:hypothetical protein